MCKSLTVHVVPHSAPKLSQRHSKTTPSRTTWATQWYRVISSICCSRLYLPFSRRLLRLMNGCPCTSPHRAAILGSWRPTFGEGETESLGRPASVTTEHVRQHEDLVGVWVDSWFPSGPLLVQNHCHCSSVRVQRSSTESLTIRDSPGLCRFYCRRALMSTGGSGDPGDGTSTVEGLLDDSHIIWSHAANLVSWLSNETTQTHSLRLVCVS